MKKLLLIAIALLGLHGFAQKTFEVYNFTPVTINLYDIITNASGVNPEFHSKATPVPVPAGGSYTLVNTANIFRFPFQSPSSSPYIPTWERVNPPAPTAVLASPAAWVLGNAQVFDRMAFGEPGASFSYVSVATPTVSWPGPGYTWTAIYSVFVNPSNPNDITYTIVIF